jgi:putative Mn2+ efflux pump MntP
VERVHQLVTTAVVLYLINLAVGLGIAVHNYLRDETLLAALTVGRTTLSVLAVLLLFAAMRVLRAHAELYQEHARYLRQVVLIQLGKAVPPSRESLDT